MPLVRKGIYQDLPPAVRSGLHRDVDHALAAAGAPATQVATHLALGASPGDTEANRGHRPITGAVRRGPLIYEQLGAAYHIARATHTMRAYGIRKGARGPRRRPCHALTTAELRVVELAAHAARRTP